MKKTTIIFSASIKGHFLEYNHHIYDICCRENNRNFVFIIPQEFENIRYRFKWGNNSNIFFDLLEESECAKINHKNPIISSLETSKLLRKKVKLHNADHIFCNMLIGTVPFLPYLLPKNVTVSGIIYMIYLYRWKGSSILFKILNIIKYICLSKCKLYNKILILNDSSSSKQLNKLYHTSKYYCLPDPYVPLIHSKSDKIRVKFGINERTKLFIHFGSMNENKGTLTVLEAIKYLRQTDCFDIVFFFAGVVEDDIKMRFYKLIEELNDKVRIIIKDEFCSYDFLASLCKDCDAILIPYKRSAQSSGVIGYAAQFSKPVIATNKGLLAKLIRRYKLGILFDECNSVSLANTLVSFKKGTIASNEYCEMNNIESFQKIIRDSLY